MDTAILKNTVFFLAPILTSIQVTPQVYKTYTTRNITGLSLHMFMVAWVASVLWGIHGYYTQDMPVMVSSLATLIADSLMIYMISTFRKN
jgi:MtN3 and saliva related transmembrane protein